MADILIQNIRFIDLQRGEVTARQANRMELDALEARKKKLGTLGPIDHREMTRLKEVADALGAAGNEHLNPAFVGLKTALASADTGLRPVTVTHDNGVIKIAGVEEEAARDAETTRVALLSGLLAREGVPPPPLTVDNAKNIVPDRKSPLTARFDEAMFKAMGRVAGRMELANRVLKIMAQSVDVVGDRREPTVSSVEFANVFTRLVDKGIGPNDPNLKRRVEEAFDRVQDVGDDRPLHEFVLNLPDLEAATDIEIIPDHCRLMGSFIFASAFEELKAFQVVDKLIELSQQGMIPLMRGPAGTQLYTYWRDAPNRMSEVERQNFYAMTLGLPTGQPGVAVNSDFQDLWLRFVSSVSTLVRESRVENLLRSNLPLAVNQQQVKKAARDLANNMSSRGYGMAFYAAADLNQQINDIIQLLSNKELQRVFGATSPYDVIEQVSQTELGGARNSSKYRMLATSGAIITNWIADHADRLRDPTAPMIDLAEVSNPPARGSGETAVSKPTDYDLVNACEMWLADSAMGEDRVAQLSEPRESPQQTSRPIQIPSIARDLLEGAGLGLGMGLGAGPPPRANGHGGYANGHAGYGGY